MSASQKMERIARIQREVHALTCEMNELLMDLGKTCAQDCASDDSDVTSKSEGRAKKTEAKADADAKTGAGNGYRVVMGKNGDGASYSATMVDKGKFQFTNRMKNTCDVFIRGKEWGYQTKSGFNPVKVFLGDKEVTAA